MSDLVSRFSNSFVQSVKRYLDQLHRYRALTGLSAVVLTAAYLSVLYHVVDVVGGLSIYVAEIVIVGGLALFFALRVPLSPRRAVILGSTLFTSGLFTYVATTPAASFDISRHIPDIIALLTGLSILQLTNANVWALGIMPAPVFLSWYFWLRREYIYGVSVGAAILGLFVLTGDAGTLTTLVGVLGMIGVVGFGELDHRLQTAHSTDPNSPGINDVQSISNQLTRRMLLIAIGTTSISIIPGGEAQPLLPDRGTTTVEGSLTSNSDQVSVLGSIRLTPKVRFTVTAEQAAYWRVGGYDRYTGDDWVRTGNSKPYAGPLERPPGDTERLRQSFRAEAQINTMPAAWKPVRLGTGADNADITSLGGFQPRNALRKGDQYSVESYRPQWTEEELQTAGQEYPEAITDRYLQIPESTPQRVARFTADLVADSTTPYDAAKRIERWLETNKEYSLDVTKPDGDIAAGFLFNLDRGYCVYYATAMTVMLRTQGIPARFVVGYTPGQKVGETQWVVRGFDSHAWVEVYFPNIGWVKFDPTPSGPRIEAEQSSLQSARVSGESNIDTNLSSAQNLTPEESNLTANTAERPQTEEQLREDTPVGGTTPDQPRNESLAPAEQLERDPGASVDTGGNAGNGGITLTMPDAETTLYGLLLIAGGVTGLRRVGLFQRLSREIWLRRTPEGSPAERLQRAYKRVEYLLGREYRPRREDEPPRAYLEALRAGHEAIDKRAVEVYTLYEQARYNDRLTEEMVDRAVKLSQALISDHR